MTLKLEPIRIAWQSLRANAFGSLLTASGIAIGIFAVIGVMTVISAIESNVQNGMSFLGANVFQFAKYPATFTISGDEQFKNRPNIGFGTYLTFVRLMEDHVPIICPKVFDKNITQI